MASCAILDGAHRRHADDPAARHRAEITNLENGRQIEVRVNDRGPATPSPHHRPLATRGCDAPGHIHRWAPHGSAYADGPECSATAWWTSSAAAPGCSIAIGTVPPPSPSESLPPPGGGAGGPAQTIVASAPRSQEDTAPTVAGPPARAGVTMHLLPAPGHVLSPAMRQFRPLHLRQRQVASKLSGLGADVVRSRDGRQSDLHRPAPAPTPPSRTGRLQPWPRRLRAGVIDATNHRANDASKTPAR